MTSTEAQQDRFSKMTRRMFDRSLQQGFGFDTPAPSPSYPGFPSYTATLAPTPSFGGFPAPVTQPPTKADTKSNFQKAQPLIFLILIFLAFFGMYKIYQTCRQRREAYLMRLRSVQADQVLGDMQMVPSEDPDAELL